MHLFGGCKKLSEFKDGLFVVEHLSQYTHRLIPIQEVQLNQFLVCYDMDLRRLVASPVRMFRSLSISVYNLLGSAGERFSVPVSASLKRMSKLRAFTTLSEPIANETLLHVKEPVVMASSSVLGKSLIQTVYDATLSVNVPFPVTACNSLILNNIPVRLTH